MNSWELLKDRDNGKVYVLGHRGSPLIERENTLQSFCRAIDEGADGVELDVHPTLDDHLVVSHDNSLKRVFGIDKKIEDITFEELDAILSGIRNKDRVGFTLDTAHLFGAGYDVKEDPDGVLDSFFFRFGEEKLLGMHLNDSKVPLSSNKDRHESIGLGLIGKEAFLTIVRRREVRNIPLILETPDESRWKEEINELLGTAER